MELVTIGILNKDTTVSHGIETVCSIGWSERLVIMKYVVTIIPLMEFNKWSLSLEYVSWSYIRGFVIQGVER